MAEEKELSRERIAPCPFCSHDSEGKGGLFKVLVRADLTKEELEEARIHNGVYASPTRDYTEFICGAGVKDCLAIKTYELAHQANTRDTSEPRFVG